MGRDVVIMRRAFFLLSALVFGGMRALKIGRVISDTYLGGKSTEEFLLVGGPRYLTAFNQVELAC